jgi:hypothetical protein
MRWGGLRRLTPVSRVFGFDRGMPIDRFFIDEFLDEHRERIQGSVLEIADGTYTRRFGRDVVRSDVLYPVPGNSAATVVGDLATGAGVPMDSYDCIILTQTLQFIYDFTGAVKTCHDALRSRGTLLATISGTSQISRYDMDRWGEYWRFTDLAARKVFCGVFGDNNVEVSTYGNVLACVAFLHGLSVGELRRSELLYRDPDYQLIIAVCARKS